MSFKAADPEQTKLIQMVLLMEEVALENFKSVTGVKIGKDLVRYYFEGNIKEWRTMYSGDVPVEVVDGYEISLVLQ